jgi:hypothetical protein
LKVFWFIVLRDYYLKKWELEEDRCLGLHPQVSGIVSVGRPFGRGCGYRVFFSQMWDVLQRFKSLPRRGFQRAGWVGWR